MRERYEENEETKQQIYVFLKKTLKNKKVLFFKTFLREPLSR